MPELPEVETVMRGMRARLEGRLILRAEVRRPDLRWALPERLAERLEGARIDSFRRRAKYILMRLDHGTSVLLHLGMSGRITIRPNGAIDREKHEHVVIGTNDGWEVAFVDPRRFGSIDLVPTATEEKHRLLVGIGPEPLDAGFTSTYLKGALTGRRTSIKAALLDQRVVAGLGNIYVCEALFRAGLSPSRLAGQVPTRHLVSAIKATMLEAIAAGGSTLRDYVQPGGELGYFQHAWRVYGRQGKPCPECPGGAVCGGILRISQGGRSTFYCPKRQR